MTKKVSITDIIESLNKHDQELKIYRRLECIAYNIYKDNIETPIEHMEDLIKCLQDLGHDFNKSNTM